MLPGAILFDLDDTLADRAAGLRRYAHLFHDHFAREMHSCAREDMHDAFLKADDFGSIRQAEALATCHLWRTPPEPDRLHDHWNAHFGSMAVCFPGGLDLLAELHRKSIKLGVVTNGGSAMQRSKLGALGIEKFMGTVVISSEVGLEKPDPAIFLLALERLGCEPGDAWFVGDHPTLDVQGAAAAGLAAFWVRTGAHRESEGVAGVHLRSLAGLREHVEG